MWVWSDGVQFVHGLDDGEDARKAAVHADSEASVVLGAEFGQQCAVVLLADYVLHLEAFWSDYWVYAHHLLGSGRKPVALEGDLDFSA